MKQLFICSLFLYISISAYSQVEDHKVIDRSGENGTILYYFQKEEIEGTQFWKDQWVPANLYGYSRVKFQSVNVKFDVYNNKFIFQRNDSSYELSSNIITINLYPNPTDTSKKITFKKGYSINAKINAETYVQVLAEGKLSLLKYYSKDLEEYTEYGNANKLKRFKDAEQYYIYQNKEYYTVNLSAKTLEAQMQSKWTEIESYLKKNNLSAKNEKDWITIISYYNSL